jgi:sulfatase maturation enzyme AslB (radical SAM superfamily)
MSGKLGYMLNIRKRSEPAANYSAVFIDGKTLRIPLNPALPITELKFPEFYDLSFGNRCETGKCPWCYAKGNPKGKHYADIVGKIQRYFGSMTQTQRPFQVAIGGQQEPLEHPEFWAAAEALSKLGIVPNYTTNGVPFNESVIERTKQFCGGVAITMHPHLEQHWREAIKLAVKHGIKTNVHFIVSDEKSVEQLKKLYAEYNGLIDYFVLLPHMNVGYAQKNPKSVAYDEMEKWLDTVHNFANIAFGANFYRFLTRLQKWDVSLYPPEILSKYLVMDDKMQLYNNSFEMKPVV